MIDTIHQLIDVITGYQPAAVVTAADRIGLFAALSPTDASTPLTWRPGWSVDETSLTRLLAATEAIGLVSRSSDGWLCSEFVAEELGAHGDLRHVVRKEAFFAESWLDLAETVRTGSPRLAPWRQRLHSEPEQAHAFLEALDVLARRTGPDLARLTALAPDKHVLDVGGGLGSYTRAVADAGSTVTMVDLPEVVEWARPGLVDLIEGQTVVLVAADVLDHPSCGVGRGISRRRLGVAPRPRPGPRRGGTAAEGNGAMRWLREGRWW